MKEKDPNQNEKIIIPAEQVWGFIIDGIKTTDPGFQETKEDGEEKQKIERMQHDFTADGWRDLMLRGGEKKCNKEGKGVKLARQEIKNIIYSNNLNIKKIDESKEKDLVFKNCDIAQCVRFLVKYIDGDDEGALKESFYYDYKEKKLFPETPKTMVGEDGSVYGVGDVVSHVNGAFLLENFNFGTFLVSEETGFLAVGGSKDCSDDKLSIDDGVFLKFVHDRLYLCNTNPRRYIQVCQDGEIKKAFIKDKKGDEYSICKVDDGSVRVEINGRIRCLLVDENFLLKTQIEGDDGKTYNIHEQEKEDSVYLHIDGEKREYNVKKGVVQIDEWKEDVREKDLKTELRLTLEKLFIKHNHPPEVAKMEANKILKLGGLWAKEFRE